MKQKRKDSIMKILNSKTLLVFTVLALVIGVIMVGCAPTQKMLPQPSDAPKPETEEVASKVKHYSYPVARKGSVVEDFHGNPVADPYRWMEDPEDPEVLAWVEAQNVLTQKYIQEYPDREKIETRLTELWNYPKYSLPIRKGDRVFFRKNDGLQNQSVLYVRDSLNGEPRILLDPNTLSEDGTIAVSGVSYSRDGALIAYRLSTHGSDWQEVHVRNVSNGEDYPNIIQWCRFASIAWSHDNSGFYYDRYPEPGVIPEEERKYHNKIYWHFLNTPQSEDRLVYERPDFKELGFSVEITDDGDYLVLHVWHGTDRQNRVYYRPIKSEGEFIRLLDTADAGYYFIDNDSSVFYFQTDLDAPRGRIIAIDTKDPSRANWNEILPEREDVISFVTTVNDQFVIATMQDAHHRLFVYAMDGTLDREIELPTIGSIAGLSGRRQDSDMFLGFQSFLYPTSAFRYDFASGELTLFRESGIDFDPSGYETRQVFFTSKDGTQVPMFLTHKKGLDLDGDNPTFLYGYGGFKISLTPSFSISRIIWLEAGGVYAHTNLRGGGEYGEDWHQAGMLENKQNVFDDFIAAGEWLIENGYTSTPKLAIHGRSNGGLLVATCLTQRPDLFGAVVCGVPVIDMLRYHRFTIGKYWTGEYGNAEENADDYNFMIRYSPLHNVRAGETYPPTLVTTADTDDRVVPAHAKKFVATLQAADSGQNPILVRVEIKAGHGHGKPTTKVIEEWSDIYGFLFRTFGMIPGETVP